MANQRPEVIIYTDGACEGNPGPGGWAALLIAGRHMKELAGGSSYTTNNRMELRAAIAALKALKRPCKVTLYTDSQYLQRGITEWLPKWRRNGWRTVQKGHVRNQDLWQELAALLDTHEIEWCWTRGHAGDPYNEYVDRLAREAVRTYGRQAPPDMDSQNHAR